MIVTAKDLRFKTAFLFDVLDKTKEIIITHRGKAKAKLVPIEQKEKKSETELFGMWKDKDIDVEKTVRELRKSRNFQ